MQELTQRGINVLKSGDRAEARKLLHQAVKNKPEDTIAWLWLSGAVEEDEQRIFCLRQVLKIDPKNQAAIRGLEKLQSRNVTALSMQETVEPVRVEEADNSLQEQSLPVVEQTQPTESQPQNAQPLPEGNISATFVSWKSAEVIRQSPPERIFRIRPSQVPALACFWLFLIGTVLLATLVAGQPQPVMYLVIAIGVILEFIVLFVIIRNFRSQYELTDQYFSIPFHAKKIRIPLSDLLHVEIHRSFWQKIRGTADILIDSVIGGELIHLRLRDLAGYSKVVDQIKSLATNQDG